MNINLSFVILVAVFMGACAAADFWTRKIPNWLNVSAAVIGLAYHVLAPGGAGLVWAVAGFAVGFSLLLLPWLLGGGGMGDVKMLAALGTWLGPLGILVAFGLGSLLAAGGMMIVLTGSMIKDGFSATRKRYVVATAGPLAAGPPPRKNRRVLPFAVPMAVSTLVVLGWLLLRSVG